MDSVEQNVQMSHACLTLDAYTNRTETYFISNSSFVFWSSIHRVEFNLNLENLTNIAHNFVWGLSALHILLLYV